MINKSGLWFLTVFSIIIVLSIYYSIVPRDNLNMVFSNVNTSLNQDDIVVSESVQLTAMRVAKEESDLEELKRLQSILLNTELTIEDKNEAYEQIKFLNNIKSLEEKIENNIEEEFKVASFVELKNANATIVISNKDKDVTLANNIINTVNKYLGGNYYITVKFDK